MISNTTKRAILRSIHLIFTIPILGYIYGEPAEVQQYAAAARFVFVPVLILSGYWMYSGVFFAIIGVAVWLGAYYLSGVGVAILSQVALFIARKTWLVIRARRSSDRGRESVKGMIKDPKRFGESIVGRTWLARNYHDLWIAIAGDALRADYSPDIGKFRNLFKTTEIASRLAFIITLCSLYDTDRRAVTITRYASHVWQGNKSPLNWKSQFKRASEKVRRLYLLRNNYFAHVNESTFQESLFQEAGLTYQDLSDLMADTWNLVSDLTVVGGVETPNSNFIVGDLRTLFPKIKLPLGWADLEIG